MKRHEPTEDWENYSYFENNKKEMLNIITTEKFTEWLRFSQKLTQ